MRKIISTCLLASLLCNGVLIHAGSTDNALIGYNKYTLGIVVGAALVGGIYWKYVYPLNKDLNSIRSHSPASDADKSKLLAKGKEQERLSANSEHLSAQDVELIKKFPEHFTLAEHYHKRILESYKQKAQEVEKSIDDFFSCIDLTNLDVARQAKRVQWSAVVSPFNMGAVLWKPWIYVINNNSRRIYDSSGDYSIAEKIKEYKIHLMPQEGKVESIIAKLVECMRADNALNNAINDFKFDITQNMHYDRAGNVIPKIVIYPALGKENAQLVLNRVYEYFKSDRGSDITPRFNEKVTDLIYFAHGNGDDKNDGSCADHFEFPDKIYYREDVIDYVANVERVNRNQALVSLTNPYRLMNPAQQ